MSNIFADTFKKPPPLFAPPPPPPSQPSAPGTPADSSGTVSSALMQKMSDFNSSLSGAPPLPPPAPPGEPTGPRPVVPTHGTYENLIAGLVGQELRKRLEKTAPAQSADSEGDASDEDQPSPPRPSLADMMRAYARRLPVRGQ